jgi:hypothetical protein
LCAKWLALLKEIAPGVTRAAVLRDPAVAAGIGQFAVIQSVAPSVGVDVSPVNITDAAEIERAVTAFANSANGGLISTASALSAIHRDLIITLAARHKLPAVYQERYYVAGGWLAWPSLLVYGTGGLAYGEVKAHTTINQAQVVPLGSVVSNFGASSSISQIRTGWTAGGGFELMLAQNWSAKIEYLYYDLGTGTSNALLVDPSTTPIPFFTNNVQTTTHFNGNIVRVGLNYQFH